MSWRLWKGGRGGVFWEENEWDDGGEEGGGAIEMVDEILNEEA